MLLLLLLLLFLIALIYIDIFPLLSENRDYAAIRTTVSATGRRCFEIVTLDNDIAEPNKNFTITLTFTPFGFSRTFDTDTPSITVEIVDDDGKNILFCLSLGRVVKYLEYVLANSYKLSLNVIERDYNTVFIFSVDPCGNNDCHTNADCLSTPGIQGYQCVCKPGFIGDGRTCVGKQPTNDVVQEWRYDLYKQY